MNAVRRAVPGRSVASHFCRSPRACSPPGSCVWGCVSCPRSTACARPSLHPPPRFSEALLTALPVHCRVSSFPWPMGATADCTRGPLAPRVQSQALTWELEREFSDAGQCSWLSELGAFTFGGLTSAACKSRGRETQSRTGRRWRRGPREGRSALRLAGFLPPVPSGVSVHAPCARDLLGLEQI